MRNLKGVNALIKKILLVCTGNTCRSSMGEWLLKELIKKDEALQSSGIIVESAGVAAFPGSGASFNAIEAMKERGIDISGHKARMITEGMAADSDIILTMTVSQKERILREFKSAAGKTYTLKEYAYGGVEKAEENGKKDGGYGGMDIRDPFGGSLEEYKKALSEIEDALKAVLERIKRESAESS